MFSETEQKYRSCIGTKINMFTIKDFIYDTKARSHYHRFKFLCDCDCGTKDKLVSCYSILKKGQKSCGCIVAGISVEVEQKYRSCIGTKHNKLTIKDFVYDPEADTNHKLKFLCDCDCGTKDKLISCDAILKSNQKSCGCLAIGIKLKTKQKYRSYIGTRYGRLTIKDFIYDPETDDNHKFMFLCDCDCGIKDELISCYGIINNHQKSCGCTNIIRLSTEERYRSYIGTKISKLTIKDFVFDETATYYQGRFKFLCDCDCGIKDNLFICDSVINLKRKSCGCLAIGIKHETKQKYKSYIGTKHGKFTITDFIYDSDADTYDGKFKFLCDCDCGTKNNLILCKSVLYNNQQNSCGCSRSHQSYQNLINYCKNNSLKLIDEYTTVKSQVINNNGNISTINNAYIFKCLVCNTTFSKQLTSFPICPKCNPNCASTTEYIISNFLIDNNIIFRKGKIINSISNIKTKVEIDFLIDIVGVELHGLTTHASSCKSSMINEIFSSKPKNYHLNKLESAKAQNIDLLQFWNTELYQKLKIVKSIILNRVGKTEHSEYARKCYVKEIDKSMSDQFLENHHIQGSVKSDSVRLGLFHKKTDNLVSVMTFGTARFSEHDWELYRFATYINCRVVGAAGKLFKHFIRNYNPTSIVSYSDRRLFNSGKLYSTLGFKLDHISAPNYWYFKRTESEHNARLYHRVQFQKHKLSKILGVFDPELTEWENMENNNYLRVYDCGNKVYIWKKDY